MLPSHINSLVNPGLLLFRVTVVSLQSQVQQLESVLLSKLPPLDYLYSIIYGGISLPPASILISKLKKLEYQQTPSFSLEYQPLPFPPSNVMTELL